MVIALHITFFLICVLLGAIILATVEREGHLNGKGVAAGIVSFTVVLFYIVWGIVSVVQYFF